MRRRSKAAVLAFALVCFHTPAPAQEGNISEPSADKPVSIRADEITHSRSGNVVTAAGSVEIAQEGLVLRAEKVVYDKSADRMSAAGDVVLIHPSGDAFYADTVEISGDLKDAVAQGIRVRLRDKSRFESRAGRLIGGTRTEFDEAIYTTCPLCGEDPRRPPPWRIRAQKVVRDTEKETIVYRDAVLEVWGVPVLYTPYFEQPDVEVRRKTGLLVPTFGSHGELGMIARVPVFLEIAPDRDMTFTPILTENEGGVGLLEYRQRFRGGSFRAEGSITSGSTETQYRTLRGHFDADIDYDIDSRWRSGAAISFASDDTYLGRYEFSQDRTLTSNAFVEGFFGRGYAAGNLYRFQGLRPTDDRKTIPLVVPELDFSLLSARDRLGGRFGVEGNLRSLARSVGADSVRMSLDTGWQLPYTSPRGQRLNLFARLQTDGYWIDEAGESDRPGDRSADVTGRAFPQAGLDWRYPLVRHRGGVSQVVEPIVGFLVAPRDGNSDLIPNEDSLDLEPDDTNVFDRSRATGLDLVEDGSRMYYGLQGRLLGHRRMQANVFLGQSYRFGGSDLFPAGAGLDRDLSDIVGRVEFGYDEYLGLLYRFRYDHAKLRSRRDEVSASLGPDAFRISANYLFIDNQPAPMGFEDRREINLALDAKITDSVALRGETQRDIQDGRSLWHRGEIGYREDCYDVSFSFERSLTRDRDIRPTNTFLLRVSLTAPRAN